MSVRRLSLAVLSLALLSPSSIRAQALRQLESGAGAAAVEASVHRAPAGVRPDRGRGRQDGDRGEAIQACASLDFDSGKNACLQAVSQARYIEGPAARACAGLDFDSGAVECMKAIREKTYIPEEIAACSNHSFDSRAVECFRTTGRPYDGRGSDRRRHPRYEPRPDTDSYILDSLRRIKREVESGRFGEALIDLGALIRYVEVGMDDSRR